MSCYKMINRSKIHANLRPNRYSELYITFSQQDLHLYSGNRGDSVTINLYISNNPTPLNIWHTL